MGIAPSFGDEYKDEDRDNYLNTLQKLYSTSDEYQYLNIIKDILSTGRFYVNRTKIRTMKITGRMPRYNLTDNTLPLLTTKKVNWKNIIIELLWFISGSTNEKVLSKQGVNFWKANGSRENLNELGFKDRVEGDLGPVYGFQFRYHGATYIDCNTNYTGQGTDQLQNAIKLLKTDPQNRRIIINLFNQKDIHLMVLPPCHMFIQFTVDDGKLNTIMYQRSCDMGLGVPYNITSYAVLTHMIGHICDIPVGEFIHVMADIHIYENHISQLSEQIQREPFPFPKLIIKRKVLDIDDFKIEDFDVVDYKCHPAIKMDMAL